MKFEIPALVSITGLLLGLATLAFAVTRWVIDHKLKRQLASVHVASILEGLADTYLKVVDDYGIWHTPWHVDDGETRNNVVEVTPELPIFVDIDCIEYLGKEHLNRLLALTPLENSIRSYLRQFNEHDDDPEYSDTFEQRHIFYAGFGEYVSRLAYDIRESVKAPGIGRLSKDTSLRLKQELAKRIAVSKTPAADLKSTYESVFLPISESHWPSDLQIAVATGEAVK